MEKPYFVTTPAGGLEDLDWAAEELFGDPEWVRVLLEQGIRVADALVMEAVASPA